MPILLQSSEKDKSSIAKKLKVGFINKHSKAISVELRSFISEYFAFGDFVFVDPETMAEVDRAKDLKTLQQKIYRVPSASLAYHLSRNHISKWLRARALFPLAERFKDVGLDDFENIDAVKKYLFDAIGNYRLTKARGVIAEFRRDSFDEYLSWLARPTDLPKWQSLLDGAKPDPGQFYLSGFGDTGLRHYRRG